MDAEHTAPYPAGQLHGQCTLFIRGTIYQGPVGGRLHYLIPLASRRGRVSRKNVLGIWTGPGADAFMRAHRPTANPPPERDQATPGRNLHITFSDATCHVVDCRGELHIFIESAELVPKTPGHEATVPPYQSEAHA